MRDSGKRETVSERSKKHRRTSKISRCAPHDGMGKWVYSTQRTTDMFVNRYSRIVIPTEVEGSFLRTDIAFYVR